MIGTDLQVAQQYLEKGELVAIPTETVYGLAANAFQEEAVTKIFQAKNRPSFDPLIVHTYSLESVSHFVKYIPPKAKQLAAHFWPGPLTLVLPKKDIIPDLVTSGLDTVAIRIPAHPLTLRLLQKLDFPLAAPSANPFGYISPTTAAHVDKQLGPQIPFILDGGACEVGLESSIVGFENDSPIIYRLGGVSQEAIENLVGPVKKTTQSSSNPQAPGMLISHYAPKKKLNLVTGGIKSLQIKEQEFSQKIGILAFQYKHPKILEQNQFILSKKGNLEEAARNLFAGLRFLDSLELEMIYTEWVPDVGLGRAINDRLKRASV